MTKPLALIFYENLLPGSKLTNRLENLGYRSRTIADGGKLLAEAEKDKPMVILLDLDATRTSSLEIVRSIRANPATNHVPVLAFTGKADKAWHAEAAAAGASLVAMESGVITQLPHLLEHALRVD